MVEAGGTKLPSMVSTKYDLVANICHDVDLDETKDRIKRNPLEENPIANCSYRIHIRNNGDNTWYEIQELIVKATQPDLVTLSESSILVFERKEQCVYLQTDHIKLLRSSLKIAIRLLIPNKKPYITTHIKSYIVRRIVITRKITIPEIYHMQCQLTACICTSCKEDA